MYTLLLFCALMTACCMHTNRVQHAHAHTYTHTFVHGTTGTLPPAPSPTFQPLLHSNGANGHTPSIMQPTSAMMPVMRAGSSAMSVPPGMVPLHPAHNSGRPVGGMVPVHSAGMVPVHSAGMVPVHTASTVPQQVPQQPRHHSNVGAPAPRPAASLTMYPSSNGLPSSLQHSPAMHGTQSVPLRAAHPPSAMVPVHQAPQVGMTCVCVWIDT